VEAIVHMTSLRSFIACATILAVVGCEKEATFTEPLPAYAAIHWVNAVPDTNQQDFRVVDIVTNASMFDANFRASNMFYQPIEAGSRTLRIFLSSTDPAIASQVLQESTLSLAQGSGYTLIHAGFARTGQTPARTVLFIPDAPPAPAAGQVGFRIVNAGAGLGNVDAWIQSRPVNPATADSLPDARAVSNLAFGAVSAYATRAADTLAADTTRLVFTATGTKTPILAAVLAPVGAAGTATANPIAGSRQKQSVLTVILVPRSVAGSAAPQTAAFTTPTVLYLVDRRPPNTAP
jgi:hypothetical protein